MPVTGLAPFVRRREQTTGLTYVVVPHQRPADAQVAPPSGVAMGMSDFTPVYDPPPQSQFLGGRGRPAYPASQDSLYYVNPWTGLGGEGASWEWEHFGYKVPLRAHALAADNPGTFGGANHPLDGHAGMIAYPERANVYRPPFESYGAVVDQRTGDVAPDWASARGANPLV